MQRNRLMMLLFISVLGAACAGQTGAIKDSQQKEAALIPRARMFDNPEKAAAEISPDGKMISFLAPVEGVLNVWVQTRGQQDARPVTQDKKRGVRIYFWANNSNQIIYLQDKGGDENWHVHRVDLSSQQDDDLTPFDGVRSGIVATSRRKPDEVLLSMNKRDRTLFDVYRLKLDTGELTEDTRNPGNVIGWHADLDLNVRAATAMDGQANTLLMVRDTPEQEWRTIRTWAPLEDGGAFAFSGDGSKILVAGNKETDTQQLFSIDIKSGAIQKIFHDAKSDFVDAMIHPDTHEVEAVATERLRKQWHVLDQKVAKDLAIIGKINKDDFQVASRSLDDTLWVVAVTGDTTGVQYHLYDRSAGKTEFLFDARPALAKYRLAPMEPVEIPARDGLPLVSYLTRPLDAGSGKLPMVLFVHGGPWARDQWGYHPYAQWLSNRGYVVLQVNYRGSEGFGKKFLNAGNKEWGREMQNDLTDAVQWAIANASVDPKRVAIMGGSYGGYAALAGVTFTPDLYAAAVDMVGPSNIITLLKSVPPYWKPLLAKFQARVGDMQQDAQMLQERSPLNHADKIRTPLFIFQGANDPRVKQAESDQIVKAIRDRGGRVDYVIYSDEGHGFQRPPNRMDFVGRSELFLAEHLKGRSQPFTPPEGTTAQVK